MRTNSLRVEVLNSSPLPAYRQAQEQIRRYIIEKGLKAGEPLPDIRSIAEGSNVSVKTIFLGVNELVKEGVCIRRPKKGTFVGDFKKPAAKLKRKLCLLWHPEGELSVSSNEMVALFNKGVRSVAVKTGMDALFAAGDMRDSLSFYSASAELALAGVLVLNPSGDESVMALAKDFPSIPFIHVNHIPAGFDDAPENVKGVFNDEFSGAFQLVDFMLRQGRRKLAVIDVAIPFENYKLRVAGALRAAEDAGAKLRKSLLEELPEACGDQSRAGRETAAKIFASAPDVDCVFCVNDLLASGAADFLEDSGLASKVSLAGYDRLHPELCLKRGFASAAVDFEALAAKAASLLGRALDEIPRVSRVQPQLYLGRQALQEALP